MQLVKNRQVNSSNWWLLALQGTVAAIVGILIVVWPQHTLAIFIYLFGVFAIVNGIFAIGLAISKRKEAMEWWAILLGGIAGVVVGVVVFAYPHASALLVAYLVATWSLLLGLAHLAAVFLSEYTPRRRVANAVIAVLCIALAMFLFIDPRSGVLTLTWLIGAFCIVYGCLLLIHVMFPGDAVRTSSEEALPESVEEQSKNSAF